VRHRRKSFVASLSHRLSVEAHRLSVLSTTLQELRKALDRLTREVLICLAIVLGIWQLVSEMLWRLISSLWR
jgi:hypothetical protein